MPRTDGRLVIVSGPLCAGKTTLAIKLSEAIPAEVLSARQVLLTFASAARSSREDLQSLGSDIERATAGTWLAHAVAELDAKSVVVDSARTAKQVDALERAADVASLILLDGSEAERRRRFKARHDPIDVPGDIEEIFAREIPVSSELRRRANLILNTDRLSADQVQSRVLDYLGLSFPKDDAT